MASVRRGPVSASTILRRSGGGENEGKGLPGRSAEIGADLRDLGRFERGLARGAAAAERGRGRRIAGRHFPAGVPGAAVGEMHLDLEAAGRLVARGHLGIDRRAGRAWPAVWASSARAGRRARPTSSAAV